MIVTIVKQVGMNEQLTAEVYLETEDFTRLDLAYKILDGRLHEQTLRVLKASQAIESLTPKELTVLKKILAGVFGVVLPGWERDDATGEAVRAFSA